MRQAQYAWRLHSSLMFVSNFHASDDCLWLISYLQVTSSPNATQNPNGNIRNGTSDVAFLSALKGGWQSRYTERRKGVKKSVLSSCASCATSDRDSNGFEANLDLVLTVPLLVGMLVHVSIGVPDGKRTGMDQLISVVSGVLAFLPPASGLG